MTPPYALPLFLLALVLVTYRSQFQGVLLVLVAPYVWDIQTFLLIVVFTSASHLFGRMRSAGDTH